MIINIKGFILKVLSYVALLAIGVGVGLFIGCKTLTPSQIKHYSPACNDKITVMKLMVQLGITDTAALREEQSSCNETRYLKKELKKRDHCRVEAYGVGNPIDKTKSIKYIQFLECVKDLDTKIRK